MPIPGKILHNVREFNSGKPLSESKNPLSPLTAVENYLKQTKVQQQKAAGLHFAYVPRSLVQPQGTIGYSCPVMTPQSFPAFRF